MGSLDSTSLCFTTISGSLAGQSQGTTIYQCYLHFYTTAIGLLEGCSGAPLAFGDCLLGCFLRKSPHG